MPKQSALVMVLWFASPAWGASLHDCSSLRPETAGLHNMVLFGNPQGELYVYHLPLFAGTVNGTSGHVFMHVYQGVWKIQLDTATKAKYDQKFFAKQTAERPLPFFSIAPREKRFKVPEMICDAGFSLRASGLISVPGNRSLSSLNNKFKLPLVPRDQSVQVLYDSASVPVNVEVNEEVYFNQNGDLQVRVP